MSALIYGTLLLGSAFLLHLVWWRIHLPKRQTKVLVLLFLGVLFSGSAVLCMAAEEFTLFGVPPPGSLAGFLQMGLYFISFTLAYMITYSAIEVDSPSLLIVLKIAQAGQAGLDPVVLRNEMDNHVLVVPRVRDLLTDRMAELRDGKYRLREKGRLMALLFSSYRGLMGAGKGG